MPLLAYPLGVDQELTTFDAPKSLFIDRIGSSKRADTPTHCRRRLAWYSAGFEIRCPRDSGVQISPSAPLFVWN